MSIVALGKFNFWNGLVCFLWQKRIALGKIAVGRFGYRLLSCLFVINDNDYIDDYEDAENYSDHNEEVDDFNKEIEDFDEFEDEKEEEVENLDENEIESDFDSSYERDFGMNFYDQEYESSYETELDEYESDFFDIVDEENLNDNIDDYDE